MEIFGEFFPSLSLRKLRNETSIRTMHYTFQSTVNWIPKIWRYYCSSNFRRTETQCALLYCREESEGKRSGALYYKWEMRKVKNVGILISSSISVLLFFFSPNDFRHFTSWTSSFETRSFCHIPILFFSSRLLENLFKIEEEIVSLRNLKKFVAWEEVFNVLNFTNKGRVHSSRTLSLISFWKFFPLPGVL